MMVPGTMVPGTIVPGTNIGVDVSRIESVEVEIATATALTQVLVRVRDENGIVRDSG